MPPTAFIMGCAAACRAGIDRDWCETWESRPRAFDPEVTRPRTLLWISSGLKLCGSIQVPASIPATLRPARASGSTATPPAAPSPTTATSTGFKVIISSQYSVLSFQSPRCCPEMTADYLKSWRRHSCLLRRDSSRRFFAPERRTQDCVRHIRLAQD